MIRRRTLPSVMLAALAIGASAGPARAQVSRVALTDRGRPVPVALNGDLERLGRTVTLGLLATAHRDVTRPVSDEEVEALGRRGTLLRVGLDSPEDVLLVRLGARSRATRMAAYVPPDRDDRAFVFLGRSSWDRIVVVALPDPVRSELRRLRAEPAAGGR